MRRDLINSEIANLRDLLPLPSSTRQRLSQLQLMALVLVYVRKSNYFNYVSHQNSLALWNSLIYEKRKSFEWLLFWIPFYLENVHRCSKFVLWKLSKQYEMFPKRLFISEREITLCLNLNWHNTIKVQ